MVDRPGEQLQCLIMLQYIALLHHPDRRGFAQLAYQALE